VGLLRLLVVVFSILVVVSCGGGSSGGGSDSDSSGAGDAATGQVIFTGLALDYQVFMSADGNGVAVWRADNDDGDSSIWSSRYTASTDSWSVAAEISNNYDRDISGFRAAASDSGDVHVVWVQAGPTVASFESDQVWGNHYQPGTGWSGDAEIVDLDYNSTNIHVLNSPKVSVNNTNEAVLVWKQIDKTGVSASDYVKSLHSKSFDAWGWSATLLVNGDIKENSENFYELSINDDGDAVAVWSDEEASPATEKYIKYSFFSVGTASWTAADFIEADPLDNINNFNTVKLQLFQDGNATVVWSYLTADTAVRVSSIREYTAASTTWAVAQSVTPDISRTNRALDVKFNRTGEGFYLYTESAAGDFPLYASAYTFTSGVSGFNATQTITGSSESLTPLRSSIAIDDSANAIALWGYKIADNEYGQRARRYTSVGGWADVISFGDFSQGSQSTIGIVPDGDGESAMTLVLNLGSSSSDNELIATKIDFSDD
jgi:hypothetical protein